MKKNILLLLISFFISISIFAQKTNYNKYSIKLSISNYNGYLFDFPLISFGDDINIVPNLHFNSNIHFTYKISEISEFGIYLGFVKYNFINLFDDFYFDHVEGTAPIFGINYNLNILSLFFKTTKKYSIYFTIKYGLSYLSRMGEDNAWIVLMFNDPFKSRLRQEYGMGIGGSVLFFNHIGLFLETYLGNFSLYPDLISSNSNTKIGIQFSW